MNKHFTLFLTVFAIFAFAGCEEVGEQDNFPSNQIWYTSTDDQIVTPYAPDVFGANIVSNTYENGNGVITFDGDVTAIGRLAFSDCENLDSIIFGEKVTSIGEMAFAYTHLATITIPQGVTSISAAAFSYCSNLEGFNSKYASEDGRCLVIDGILHSFAPAGLTEYTIPQGISSIGVSAFLACYQLTKVTIPKSVTSIGNLAFGFCASLESVYCKPTTPPSGGSDIFQSNASGYKIYVPTNSVEAYKTAAGWNIYANHIVGYDF